jgi:hypothetical protein
VETIRMYRLAIPMFLALVCVACTNSGLGDAGVLDSDSDSDSDDPGVGNQCKWSGDWLLTNVKCSSFDIDEWFEKYATSRMVISDDGTGSGNCTVDFNWRASQDACVESETWTMTVTGPNEVDILFGGITECSPSDCVFPNDAETCLVGDRSLATPMSFTFDDSTQGEILTAGLLAPAWEQCTLDLVTTWTQQ